MNLELNKIHTGDVMSLLKQLPDGSVDCIITSPSYWQLRDYGWEGQWGLEKTFQEYLERMWNFMDECKRVLTKHGTCWINLGDTYNTTSGKMGHQDIQGDDKKYSKGANQAMNFVQQKETGLPSKCQLLIPHRFAIGCIDRGWIVRNDICWIKRNGMSESVKDRFAKKHEYFFLLVKSKKYYFDLDGIKDKLKASSITRYKTGGNGNTKRGYTQGKQNNVDKWMNNKDALATNIESGKNPGSVAAFWNGFADPEFQQFAHNLWNIYLNNPSTLYDITTRGVVDDDNHFATYNPKLIEKPIVAGCPEQVCLKCGKPREKMFEGGNPGAFNLRIRDAKNNPQKQGESKNKVKASKEEMDGYEESLYSGEGRKFTGWTDCGCKAGFRKGIVLDPFAGTGTTLHRAHELGRDVIGFEGKVEYADVANKKLSRKREQHKLEFTN